MMEDTILEVENLRTSFATDAGSVQSVRGITFHVGKGESLGIVGESGCGKSVTMLSIMGLLEDNASRQADALLFDGEDLLKKSPREMRKIQGNRIGMIFQDPMTSLNPVYTIGNQIVEVILLHTDKTKKEMEKILNEIQSGTFVKEWVAEYKGGLKKYNKLLADGEKHPIEKVGQRLRSLMPWAAKQNIKGAQASYSAVVEAPKAKAAKAPAKKGKK